MDKIYIRLKDKTSTYWIAEQSVSLVGEIPKEVEKSGFVTKLLKNGVAETVSDEFAKKYLQDNEQKEEAQKDEKKADDLQKQIRIITDKIKEGKFDLANQIIVKVENLYGESGKLALLVVKEELKEQILQAEKEKKETEEVLKLITSAIEGKIIVQDKNGYSIDGKVVAETEEAMIGYLLKSKKNRNTIEKKVEDFIKEKEANLNKGAGGPKVEGGGDGTGAGSGKNKKDDNPPVDDKGDGKAVNPADDKKE